MRIPVIVLSGFLGSGKTTLLLHMLKESRIRGLRPAVIMNELGGRDVDSRILSETSDAAIEQMLDGCICCSRKSELAGTIRVLAKQNPDVIFIELTGVANPEEIADALTEPGVLGLVRLNQTVTVLDAEHVLLYNSIFEADLSLVRTLRRQIETADLILVNKSDLVTDTKLKKIDKAISKQNSKAVVLQTTYSRIDQNLVLSTISRQERQAPSVAQPFQMVKAVPMAGGNRSESKEIPSDNETQSFTRIQTMTLTLSPNTVPTRKQIERIISRFKGDLLRAKGYIRLKEMDDKASLMQYAGKRITWADSDYPGDPYIVFIGIDINEQKIQEEWERIII